MGTKPVPDPPPFLGEGEASWRESHEHHCCRLKPGVHPGLWSDRVKFWKSNTCKTFHQQTMIHLCRSTCSTCPYSQPSQRHIFLYKFQCRRLKAEPWGGLVYGVQSLISQEYQIKLPSFHHIFHHISPLYEQESWHKVIGKCTIHTHLPDMAEVSDTASQFPLYSPSQLHPTTHLKIQVLEYATKSYKSKSKSKNMLHSPPKSASAV